MQFIQSEYYNQSIESFNVTINPKLSIISYDNLTDERGVFCSTDNDNFIHENELLFQIPLNSLFTIDCAVDTPFEHLICLVDNEILREDDFLSFLLSYEKIIMQNQSKWYCHIKILPKSYNNILNYSDEELKLIEGSNLYTTAINWKVQSRNDYEEFCKKLLEYNLKFEWFNFEEYLWAFSTICSRFISITLNKKLRKSMVPVVDLLNHQPNSLVGHHVNLVTNTFEVKTAQKWFNNEEIYLNYGNLSNSRLLMLYGFCIKENPHSSVEVWANMNPDCDNYKLKKDLLNKFGITDSNQPFLINSNTLPFDLIIFLRVQLASDDELAISLEKSMISLQNELLVCNSLEQILYDLLSRYPTDFDDDVNDIEHKMLDFIPPNDRRTNSLVLIYSEKKCLLNTVKLLKQYRENISGYLN